MRLIVLGDELPRSYSFELTIEGIMWITAMLVSAVLIALLSIWIAVDRGQRIDVSQDKMVEIQEQLLFERYELDEFYAYADSVFVEYAKQAGTLQARVARLETLGGRLADMAEFDEFDFTASPAFGGPEELSGEDAVSEQANILIISKELSRHLARREAELKAIESLLANKQLLKDTYIAGKPLETGWLTSGFGKRIDPFTGRVAWHKGVDYTDKEGADIRAVASGVVLWSDMKKGYGRMVEIDHGDGFVTRYAHNKKNNVAVGDLVTKGQVIAQMGSSGRSTGNHVHFEVLKLGKAVDPIQYIYRKAL
jgi:murein DD-endopeptidase MepM/ murein hydrolase activator NlpD